MDFLRIIFKYFTLGWRRLFLGGFLILISIMDGLTYRVVFGQWMPLEVFTHSVFALYGMAVFFLGLSAAGNGRLFYSRLVFVGSWVVFWVFLVIAFSIWVFVFQNGVLLSHDTALMLSENAGRVFLHGLQTSPMLLISSVAAIFISAIFVRHFFMAVLAFPVFSGFLKGVGFASLGAILLAGNAYALLIKPSHGSPLFTALNIVALEENKYKEVFDYSVCRVEPKRFLSGVAANSDKVIENRPNVIFILAESLRHDLVKIGGGKLPFFDEISKEGVLYKKSYATSSHSDYSDLSFWYSQYPLRAHYRKGYPSEASWRGVSVFEHLRSFGYRTAYYSSQNEKWGGMISWIKGKGVDEFFHSEDFDGKTWENSDDENGLARLVKSGAATAGKVEDSQTLRLALQWITKNKNSPFAIGLNLQNTHYNYVIPEGGKEPFQPSSLGFKQIYYSWPSSEAINVKNKYLNAAYNLGEMLSRFRVELVRLGVWDNTVFVIVGDNGEAFYEHGFGNHSGPMFDEVARTYSVVKFPKGDKRNGRSWESVVSHIDFVPIVLEAIGVPSSPSFQGVSDREGTPVFMHVNAMVKEYGVVDYPFKLMKRTFPLTAYELFNLDTDPLEKINIVNSESEVARNLLNKLNAWMECQVNFYSDPLVYNINYLK